ncbi:MAG: DUF6520 family protein [Flavobacterium sp.]
MRTNNFKLSLPIGVFFLAIAGAFASHSSETSPKALQTGWVDTPSPCQIEVSCRTEVGPVCTMFHQGQNKQAFGKVNPNDATCSKILYKIL